MSSTANSTETERQSPMTKQLIGADALIRFNDQQPTQEVAYFSFEGYDETTLDPDDYVTPAGVPDWQVFFYTDKGLTELQGMVKPDDTTSDWTVLRITELFYKVENEDVTCITAEKYEEQA